MFADLADIKLPYAMGHSRDVARLAAAAGAIGYDADTATPVRRRESCTISVGPA